MANQTPNFGFYYPTISDEYWDTWEKFGDTMNLMDTALKNLSDSDTTLINKITEAMALANTGQYDWIKERMNTAHTAAVTAEPNFTINVTKKTETQGYLITISASPGSDLVHPRLMMKDSATNTWIQAVHDKAMSLTFAIQTTGGIALDLPEVPAVGDMTTATATIYLGTATTDELGSMAITADNTTPGHWISAYDLYVDCRCVTAGIWKARLVSLLPHNTGTVPVIIPNSPQRFEIASIGALTHSAEDPDETFDLWSETVNARSSRLYEPVIFNTDGVTVEETATPQSLSRNTKETRKITVTLTGDVNTYFIIFRANLSPRYLEEAEHRTVGS